MTQQKRFYLHTEIRARLHVGTRRKLHKFTLEMPQKKRTNCFAACKTKLNDVIQELMIDEMIRQRSDT